MKLLTNGMLVEFIKSGTDDCNWLLQTSEGREVSINDGTVGLIVDVKLSNCLMNDDKHGEYTVLAGNRLLIDVNDFMVKLHKP